MVAFFLCGCVGPLDDAHYTRMNVPAERTRSIDTVDFSTLSKKEGEEKPAEPPAELQLSLEECRALALANNLDLKVELVSPTVAQQSVSEEEARFEALLFGSATLAKSDTPTSSALSGSQSKSVASEVGVRKKLVTGGTLTGSLPISEFETDNAFATLNPAYTSVARFSVSQPLLRDAGPRTNTHAIRLAKYESKMAEARAKLQVMSVLADVDRIYWRLYAARKDLEVKQADYDLAKKQLETSQRRLKQGVGAEIDVTRAESGLSDRLEGLINAEGARQQAERDMKKAVHKPGLDVESMTTIVTTTPPNPVRYNLDPRGLSAAAMDQRMEMLENELQLAKDSSSIDFARNGVLPLVNLDYTYGVNGLGDSYGDALKQTRDKQFEDHTLSLSVEVPLGNEAAKSRLRRAIFERVQNTSRKSQQQLLIRKEIVDAVAAINTNWQRILAARQRTLAAARTFEGEGRQFEQGLRTSTDVLDAQSKLAEAQSAEVAAVADYQIAQVDLAVATGTLLGAGKVRWEPIVPPLDPK